MTCKNCLHYSAHKAFFDDKNGEGSFDKLFKYMADYCPHYSPCSEWVHQKQNGDGGDELDSLS